MREKSELILLVVETVDNKTFEFPFTSVTEKQLVDDIHVVLYAQGFIEYGDTNSNLVKIYKDSIKHMYSKRMIYTTKGE